MRSLAFVDLETTGATASADRITEIGIIEVDEDGSVREWQQLVNPGTRIPPFIEQLTGISNEMVAAAPPFAAVAEETLRRLAGRLFIAHNARFDYGFLKNEFKRLGVTFRAPVLCTVKLSRTLFPEYKRHNLDSLIERHGLAADARHRALADAQLIRQFWQKIHVNRSSDEIEAALKAQNARPSLPPHLDPEILDELPDTPGVYLFYADNNLPLYVGKAKDIRKRVLSHFAADHSSAKEMALAQQVRRIDWIETAGEIGALLKEAALVKQLQPAHNRQLRKNDDVCTWTLVDEGEGWLRPQLASARELDMGIRSCLLRLVQERQGSHRGAARAGRRTQSVRCPARAGENRARQAVLRPPGEALQGRLCRQRALCPAHHATGRRAEPAQAGFVAAQRPGADPRRRRSPPDRRLALSRHRAVG